MARSARSRFVVTSGISNVEARATGLRSETSISGSARDARCTSFRCHRFGRVPVQHCNLYLGDARQHGTYATIVLNAQELHNLGHKRTGSDDDISRGQLTTDQSHPPEQRTQVSDDDQPGRRRSRWV
jgi:hypothetical protein